MMGITGFFGGYNNNMMWGGDSWGPGMMNWGGGGFNVLGGMMFGGFMLVLIVWTLYWKFQSLWYAAKHDHKWWFIALLVINTAGILEILYLYVFSKKMPGHDEKGVPMVPPQQ